MIRRLVAISVAVAAGAAIGAIVFKTVGEERVGAEVKVLASKFGVAQRPGDNGALVLIERLAPGTKAGFQSAIVGTVVASLIAATATTIVVREIVG